MGAWRTKCHRTWAGWPVESQHGRLDPLRPQEVCYKKELVDLSEYAMCRMKCIYRRIEDMRCQLVNRVWASGCS